MHLQLSVFAKYFSDDNHSKRPVTSIIIKRNLLAPIVIRILKHIPKVFRNVALLKNQRYSMVGFANYLNDFMLSFNGYD